MSELSPRRRAGLRLGHRLSYRLGQDRAARVALWVLGAVVLAAASTPILLRLGVLRPYAVHYDLVRGVGSVPTGWFGGLSWRHPLGVDPLLGRDLMSRLLVAMSLSLLIAVGATVLCVLIGGVLGVVAGFLGGPIDHLISRTTDLVLAFPTLVMLLALAPVLRDRIESLLPGNGPHQTATATIYLTVVLGIFGWAPFARTIRGQVLVLREREFVEATGSLGATRRRIVFVKLPPHLTTPLLVFLPVNLRHCIAAEATLSFLGVGFDPPTPSFGTILNGSVNYVRTDPEYFVASSALIVLIMVSCTVLADGLRDALDR